VSVKIYNSLGNEVNALVNQKQAGGRYSIIWDGKDNNGIILPSGIYICILKTANAIEHRQVVLIKQHE
jgi:flagellar hook assembly protein FlgD